jgi:hypothetical protein
MAVTISDVPPLLRDLDFCLGQLRHAYGHLIAGRATNQAEFGRGLIAPEIRRLERIRAEIAASGTSGSAQDAQRLDPKGAGPTAEGGDAQTPPPSTPGSNP